MKDLYEPVLGLHPRRFERLEHTRKRLYHQADLDDHVMRYLRRIQAFNGRLSRTFTVSA
jgi:ketosteroid isomerase-like protein